MSAIGQIDWGKADNANVDKIKLRQVFAANLTRAMRDKPGLETQSGLAKATGVTQGYLSELIRGESSPTTDMLATLANALDIRPWELLADDEETREAAIRKMLMGPRVSDEKAAKHLPPAPTKEVAKRRRKKAEGGNYPPTDSL